MRIHLILAVLLLAPAATLVAPAATAQSTSVQSTTQVSLVPFEAPLTHEEVAVTKGQVKYSYMVLGSLAMSPTKVSLKIAEMPWWASAVISPSTLYFSIRQPHAPQTQVEAGTQTFVLTVSLSEDAPLGATDVIRVVAVAEPNDLIAASNAEDSMLLSVTKEPCHLAEATAADDAVALQESSADDVTTASAGTMAVASSGVAGVVGLAGLGAAAGYALRRRRS